ncbi:Cof-type HAD-IIB family hydrolase [Bacillus massilinigeriensis]|uniref:Cof-type HAD-IIB family hydrolase n=1 Tax=Bacillus massilionigeriensis TaxID=1805475 RepID=UPI00096ADF75|nr:Cof-type HAD-IIB family hydrolase [Bacillus massilionigeriensis]
MGIKLIAVDMDGTFLNDHMDFDRERFAKQYQQLKERGVHFVVASGNQYYQLKSFFGEFQDEISYIAENGAFVVDRGTEVFSVEIPKKDVNLIIEEISRYPQLSFVLCGKERAYILENESDEFYRMVNLYYHRLNRVQDFEGTNDKILKFALSCPMDQTDYLIGLLKRKIGHLVTPISSGHGSIDLIVPGFHKASGLQLLQDRWGIKKEETMAFGDGGNDLEMLKSVQYGFAMENASDEVKMMTKYRAPSNNNYGVLEIIDQYFSRLGPFKEIID